MELDFLKEYEFFSGVPDSQLQPLCNYLMANYGISKSHVIAANEGNCTALAAGYYLATGKTPVVYLQNSGIGNIINPVASLMNDKVYGIPCIFVVGWRGEPGVHDESQHIYQGEVTIKLLEDMDIKVCIVDADMTEEKIKEKFKEFKPLLDAGKQVAFVIRKDALCFSGKIQYSNEYVILREEAIRRIIGVTGRDIVISTTGKASRELFETRAKNNQDHSLDFLTVGSMGHASSIALGVALHSPGKKVWCIDGDGAMLMHMGAMAIIGNNKPSNLIHIVINNEAHETVGGMPTVANNIDMLKIAEGCGYCNCFRAKDFDELDRVLLDVKNTNVLSFLEIKCAIGARGDLGRPTISAKHNKELFMKNFK